MKKGIMIFGLPGSGKTTLGRLVAQQLGILFVDIDEYIWRNDTEIPFTAMYSRSEKISRLMEAISKTDRFVMAGSMDSFHEHFDSFFSLAVHLTAPAQVRVTRVHLREQSLLGDRILEGGDLYEDHQRYLADVASYDLGGGSTSLATHTQWAKTLPCPVLKLDGSADLQLNADIIAEKYCELSTLK